MLLVLLAVLSVAFPVEPAASDAPKDAAEAIDALVRQALDAEPALAAAVARARADRAASPIPGAPMDPMWEVEVMAASPEMASADLMISQGFMPPGALRAGRSMGEARADATEAQALGEALALESKVRGSAAMLASAIERQRVLDASRDVGLGLIASARAMVTAGMAPTGDISMAEMEVASIDGRIALAQAEEAMARADLERLVGETPATLALPPLPPAPERGDPPMIVAMAAMRRMAEAERDMARAERLPPFSLTAGVSLQTEALDGTMAIAGVSSTLPVFFARKQGARLGAAVAAADAAGDDLEAAQREITREQAGMTAELDGLAARIAAAERMRWAAVAASDAGLAAYEAGTRDIEALLFAQQRQRDAAEMLAMLRAEALTTHARLAAMLGVTLLEAP